MKILSTEAQQELQEFLDKLPEKYKLDSDDMHQLAYWAIELKPKRVRRKSDPNIQSDLTYIPTESLTIPSSGV